MGQRGEAASVLDNFVAAENVTGGVNKGLAMLLRDQRSNLVLVVLQKLLILEHIAHPLRNRCLRPLGERIFRVGDGFVELSLGGEWRLGD